MNRRPRDITDAERTVWADYLRREKIRPRHGAAPAETKLAETPAPPPPDPPGPPPPSAPTRARPAPAPHWVTVGEAPSGLDRGTWSRFHGGQMRVHRRLDLHGMTAQAAHGRFIATVLHASRQNERCIEVITGRGGPEGGILRRELPHWLNLPEVRGLVLAASHPHAANPGSVLVLLRRRR
jgi:DNA-nicking Smr family endonuclease